MVILYSYRVPSIKALNINKLELLAKIRYNKVSEGIINENCNY